MKRICLSLLLMGAYSMSAFATLAPGQTAPDFQLQASLAGKSQAFSLKQSLKKGPVVVYFYPSAFTNGCNVQAHLFAVNQEKFAAAGATVIGVLLDSIGRLNEFSADPASCAGTVAVASDADGKTARAYELVVRDAQPGRKDTRGADLDHGFAERTTFILTQDGKIAASVGGVAPEATVAKALELVQQPAGKKS